MIAQKYLKKNIKLVHTVFYLIKITIITHFLAFILFLFFNFSLLDPDPVKKMNRDEGSMRIWIHNPARLI